MHRQLFGRVAHLAASIGTQDGTHAFALPFRSTQMLLIRKRAQFCQAFWCEQCGSPACRLRHALTSLARNHSLSSAHMPQIVLRQYRLCSNGEQQIRLSVQVSKAARRLKSVSPRKR